MAAGSEVVFTNNVNATYAVLQAAWITGIRRDQAVTRSRASVIDWDATNGLVKINPLAFWTSEDVWTYIRVNELPYNELHDQGYPSIGCQPCTKPAELSSGDERAGRWSNLDKTECGIHFHDGQIVRLAEVR